MLRILYVNFYQDGYWLEEMTATLARFSFHICLGLLAIVGCGGSVRQSLLWVESSRFNDQKYDEFKVNLGQISLIVFRTM
jgi:hypothetical protein